MGQRLCPFSSFWSSFCSFSYSRLKPTMPIQVIPIRSSGHSHFYALFAMPNNDATLSDLKEFVASQIGDDASNIKIFMSSGEKYPIRGRDHDPLIRCLAVSGLRNGIPAGMSLYISTVNFSG